MIKRTRTVLFITCICLFILVAPAVILYSQGYRFDWETKKITQTGAFYFKVWPRSSEIYLNEKFKEKTSMLTGSVLIENLLPRTYRVEIRKTNYHSWQKNLEVKEKQVTEAKNIILFPQNPKFEVISTSSQEITEIISKIEPEATSSDKKMSIEQTDFEIWIVFLEKQTEQPHRGAGERVFLTRFSKKIGNVFWLTNRYLIFNVEDKIKITEIDTRDKLNIIDLAEFKNPKIFWDKDLKKLYVLSEEKLYLSEKLLP